MLDDKTSQKKKNKSHLFDWRLSVGEVIELYRRLLPLLGGGGGGGSSRCGVSVVQVRVGRIVWQGGGRFCSITIKPNLSH